MRSAWLDTELLRDQVRAVMSIPSILVEKMASSFSQVIPSWEVDRGLNSPFSFKQLMTEGYKQNIVCFACINEISHSVAEPPLIVERLTGKSGKPVVVTGHALNELITPTMFKMTARDFVEIEQTWIESVGNGYALIDRTDGERGLPVRLRPQLPSCFKPVRNKDGEVVKYLYSLGSGTEEPIPAANVAHWKGDMDPENLVLGLAPLQHAKKILKLDNEAIDTLYNFFFNGAMPLGLLKTKRKVLIKEARFIQRMWKDQYGAANRFKMGVLGGEWDFQQVGVNPKQMEISEITDTTESRLCAIWQVPPILIAIRIGLEKATYSNYGTALDDFMYRTIPPKWGKFLAVLQPLAAEYGPYRYCFNTKAIRAYQERRIDFQRLMNDSAESGFVSMNEVRSSLNLQRDSNGDVYKRTAADGSVVWTPQAISNDGNVLESEEQSLPELNSAGLKALPKSNGHDTEYPAN